MKTLLTILLITSASVAGAQSFESGFTEHEIQRRLDQIERDSLWFRNRTAASGYNGRQPTREYSKMLGGIGMPAKVVGIRRNIVCKPHPNRGAAERGQAAQSGSKYWRREAAMRKVAARKQMEMMPVAGVRN